MKYSLLVASALATCSCITFSMDHQRERLRQIMLRLEQQRQHEVQAHQHFMTQIEDAELAAALQESLLERERHEIPTLAPEPAAIARAHEYQDDDHAIPKVPAQYRHAAELHIPFEDAMAAAIAASLELNDRTPAPAASVPAQPQAAPFRAQAILQRPAPAVFTGTEECPICGSSIAELGQAQGRFTRCCGQFICYRDYTTMEARAIELYRNMHNPEWRRRFAQSEEFTGWPYPLEQADRHQHAECPFCRKYPLEVAKTKIK